MSKTWTAIVAEMGKLVWSCDVERKGVVKGVSGLHMREYVNPPLKQFYEKEKKYDKV